jgi:phenylalanyl-tRNA synthetase beta chain
MARLAFTKAEVEAYCPLTAKMVETLVAMGIPAELTSEGIEIEALANRPDLYSLPGIMRVYLTYIGKKKTKEYAVEKPGKTHRIIIKSEVESVRPYTVGALIKGMKITPALLTALIDVQEKMHLTLGRKRKKCAIGIYPADKIAFPLTFTAKKPKEIIFTPLGGEKPLSGEEILAHHPKGKEYAHLLKGATHYPVFIDATGSILSMPPIINSAETGEVTTSTKELFIECSGTHLPTLQTALALLTTLCAEQGATIQGVQVERGKEQFVSSALAPAKHAFSLEHANTLLGLSLTEKECAPLFEKMGHRYQKGTILTPPWRADIMHEVDLIEDLAIAYGYDKLVPELPSFTTTGAESFHRTQTKKIRDLCIGLGLQEISTYHLITEEEKQRYHLKALGVEGAKTEYKYLRPTLLIPALRTYYHNKDAPYPQNLFEIGTTFDEQGTEHTHLFISLSPGTITSIQQILAYYQTQLQQPLTLKQQPLPLCIPGRSALLMQGKKEMGYIGEMHPSTLKNAGLKLPLAVLELDITDFLNTK